MAAIIIALKFPSAGQALYNRNTAGFKGLFGFDLWNYSTSFPGTFLIHTGHRKKDFQRHHSGVLSYSGCVKNRSEISTLA